MTFMERIAFYKEIRSDVPNQELARELASTKNSDGIKEIAEHLWDKNNNVRSDCIKVLYEIGYIAPELIAPFAPDFLKLLLSKQNRLVWGSMYALATIASLKPAELFGKRELICKTVEQGSVITQDGGIKALSLVAAANEDFQKELTPYLLNFIRKCRLSDVPKHAEFILVCITNFNKVEYLSILQARLPEMTPSQSARVKKIIKKLQ
jgi:hypothetical protein